MINYNMLKADNNLTKDQSLICCKSFLNYFILRAMDSDKTYSEKQVDDGQMILSLETVDKNIAHKYEFCRLMIMYSNKFSLKMTNHILKVLLLLLCNKSWLYNCKSRRKSLQKKSIKSFKDWIPVISHSTCSNPNPFAPCCTLGSSSPQKILTSHPSPKRRRKWWRTHKTNSRSRRKKKKSTTKKKRKRRNLKTTKKFLLTFSQSSK